MRVFRVCFEKDPKIGPYSWWSEGYSLAYPNEGPMHRRQLFSKYRELSAQIDTKPLDYQPDPHLDANIGGKWATRPDSKSFYFGFERLEDITAWFDEQWIEVLVPMQMVINTYNISTKHVLKGHGQIVFKLEHATLVESTALQSCLAA